MKIEPVARVEYDWANGLNPYSNGMKIEPMQYVVDNIAEKS